MNNTFILLFDKNKEIIDNIYNKYKDDFYLIRDIYTNDNEIIKKIIRLEKINNKKLLNKINNNHLHIKFILNYNKNIKIINNSMIISKINIFPFFNWHILDLHKYFDNIKDIRYTVIKTDVPYISNKFPTIYPIGKDLDILCDKDDFNHIINITTKWAQTYKFFKIKIKKITHKYLLRFEKRKKLHYQIDISYTFYNLNLNTIKNIIKNSIKYNNIFIPTIKDEKKIRGEEIKINANKKHHVIWLKNH